MNIVILKQHYQQQTNEHGYFLNNIINNTQMNIDIDLL